MGRQVYYYGGTPKTLTREQTAAIVYQAGFRGEDIVKMTAIAGRESGYKYNVHGSDAPQSAYSGDRGLFQINYVNDQALMNAGIIKNRTDLFDPLINARAAKFLWDRSNGSYAPWNVGPNGWVPPGTPGSSPLYRTDVNAAREAVTSAAQKGLFGTNFNLSDILDVPILNTLPGIPNPIDIITGGVGGVISGATSVLDIYKTLASRVLDIGWWIRVLKVIAGIVLIGMGLRTLIMPVVQDRLSEVAGVAL